MAEKIYKIHSPSPKAFSFDKNAKFWQAFNNPVVKTALNKANEKYLHWEELKYKNWISNLGLPKAEDFWLLTKFYRLAGSQATPIRDAKGQIFCMNLSYYHEFLHIVDKEMAGNFMGIMDFSEMDKRSFITRNIIEESIASSQLEGANTARSVAKKMLLEGRKPHNHDEQMIVNNHLTMQLIEQKCYKEELSWELIAELHRLLTHKTLATEKQGKLRDTLDQNGNRLVIKPWDDKIIAYVTPDREFVEKELPRLINFANDKKFENETFIHPLIKAILLHFWVGLLHPFEDGNGRLARALFYWYMLRKEYWAFAYLSLSEKIKKSPKQYAMAYIYSEQDDCDATYFIHYNLNKIKLARKEFQTYVKSKTAENRLMMSASQEKYDLNERQVKLLQSLSDNAEKRTTIKMHQKLYNVAKVTAINDLKQLLLQGFLIKRKQGRNVYYYPSEKIHQLFVYE